MTVRDRLAEIPAGTDLLRQIRYLTDPELADLTDADLHHAARWLRAASYSAAEGARRLDREHDRRQKERPECNSDPSSTATHGSTGDAPKGRPRDRDR